jgi:ribosomal protein S1
MQEDNKNYGQPLEDFDWESLTNERYNSKVKLSDQDRRDNTKILCKEPYAQELYDMYKKYEQENSIDLHVSKDLEIGQLYKVQARSICLNTGVIKAVEENSGVEISIPLKEYGGDIEELKKGNGINFKVILYKANRDCEYVASEKKSRSINYRDELITHLDENTWFDVTIRKLIKGGYIATYKNEIDCFIPGSQAGANVIKDFSILLNKTISVMVDNYDKSNNLFIVSYKKYIKHSLPEKVSDLRFGKIYTGKLTNKPYPFGVFVELENYYTGLVHSSDFENYDEASRSLKAGDDIDVYVKGVTYKKNQYRIVLSLTKDSIPKELIEWDNLKEDLEGNKFDFTEHETKRNTILMYYNGESVELQLDKQYRNLNLSDFSKVLIHNVDPLNKRMNYSLTN